MSKFSPGNFEIVIVFVVVVIVISPALRWRYNSN